MGWVMRECRDDVRLGTTSEFSPSPRVVGRSLVDGRTKDAWSRRDGPMMANDKDTVEYIEQSPGVRHLRHYWSARGDIYKGKQQKRLRGSLKAQGRKKKKKRECGVRMSSEPCVAKQVEGEST